MTDLEKRLDHLVNQSFRSYQKTGKLEHLREIASLITDHDIAVVEAEHKRWLREQKMIGVE